MKYTIASRGGDQKLRLTYREDSLFIERIRHDVRNGIVSEFRHEMMWKNNPHSTRRYNQMPRVCPTAVLRMQDNGAPELKQYNGLLLLDVKPVVGSVAQEEVKQRAIALPTTMAAFTGASGQSVKLLVRVARADGSLPQEEGECARFYQQAHSELLPIYAALVAPHTIVLDCKGLLHSFLVPWDETPQFNPSAVPFRVGMGRHSLTSEGDFDAFRTYEAEFEQAAAETLNQLSYDRGQEWNEEVLTMLASKLHDKQMPREEAHNHGHRKLYYYGNDELRRRWRTIIDAVYDGQTERLTEDKKGHSTSNASKVIKTLEERYLFRHNTIMGFTEYRRNSSQFAPWRPVTERDINDLTLQLQLDGHNVWNRDVKRYIDSNQVPDYNMAEEYLTALRNKWDGEDHIRALARTVPTRCKDWPDWFHRFFLGMVAQWQQRNQRFGNAIVPLLISAQGYHKSDFCRQLLPRELASWGYTDNPTLGDERKVLQEMTQMLLICLDEFNRISPRIQEGLLKNIITLPTVKVKRPYARHVEDLPRMASFIATTNQTDVLADPSGSRRFVGIFIEGDIDTSQRPNYEQLYAQAVAELDQGERYWFDQRETEAVMRHNRQFQLRSEALMLFDEYFETTCDEQTGEWRTAADILQTIKHRGQHLLKNPPSIIQFARELKSLPDIQVKHKHNNNYYLVHEIP